MLFLLTCELKSGEVSSLADFWHRGGGHGHQAMSLRKSFPRERGRFILQDLPHVVDDKKLDDIEVMAHDMMKEQPIKGAPPRHISFP